MSEDQSSLTPVNISENFVFPEKFTQTPEIISQKTLLQTLESNKSTNSPISHNPIVSGSIPDNFEIERNILPIEILNPRPLSPIITILENIPPIPELSRLSSRRNIKPKSRLITEI